MDSQNWWAVTVQSLCAILVDRIGLNLAGCQSREQFSGVGARARDAGMFTFATGFQVSPCPAKQNFDSWATSGGTSFRVRESRRRAGIRRPVHARGRACYVKIVGVLGALPGQGLMNDELSHFPNGADYSVHSALLAHSPSWLGEALRMASERMLVYVRIHCDCVDAWFALLTSETP